ncbi:MAG: [LysW]-lysine hydrolase [Anaerolineae bacterium]|jgi:LysW-gamma-L-lysine carboxypeptidase|nr:[LysW]-lysine hydrolase [Anaerolineae bacterium]
MTLTDAATAQPVTDAAAEALLHDLVAISSPSYHEANAVKFLAQWLGTHGYEQAFVDEAGNAVGIIGRGPRLVVLLGHIDTFAGNPPVRQEGRLLYGRGSVDAKGALCTFAAAGPRARLSPDVTLMVVGAVEEECPTSKGAHYLKDHVTPALCIIGEPSAWDRITLGYKGRVLVEWRWHGGLAHSAGRELSPVDRAFEYRQKVKAYVEQFNAGRPRLFEQINDTIYDISTGREGAYGWSQMTIGLRLPPGLHPEAVAAALQPDDAATLRVYGMEYAYTADKDTSLSRALRAAIRAEGGTPAFVYKTGTSDMNIVGRAWRCPIIAYGPGDSALDHTPDEHQHLDEYLRAVRVITRALENL